MVLRSTDVGTQFRKKITILTGCGSRAPEKMYGWSLKYDCYGSRAFRSEADFGDHPSISEFLKLVLHIHSFSEFLATRAPHTVNIFD